MFFLESCRRDTADNDLEKNTQHLSLSNTHEVLPVEEFVKWVGDKENGLSKIKEISEMNYHLSYMPKECLAYMELKNDNLTKSKFDETLAHYEGMTYFNLRIELKGGQGELLKYNLSSPQQYNERINYMAFEMQKDIFLVQGNDTLMPGMFHFERIYEVAPFATVMLAFDNKKFNPESEFTVVYNDRLFNKGYIKYNYKQKQLIDLPNLSGV
jgi:hypothetical protein